MPNKKIKRSSGQARQVILPFLKGNSGTVGLSLLIISLLLQWALLGLIGWVLLFRWGYIYQKAHPKAQIWWKIVIGSLIALVLYIIIRDLHLYY